MEPGRLGFRPLGGRSRQNLATVRFRGPVDPDPKLDPVNFHDQQKLALANMIRPFMAEKFYHTRKTKTRPQHNLHNSAHNDPKLNLWIFSVIEIELNRYLCIEPPN